MEKKEKDEEQAGGEARVFLRAACSAKPDSSSFSERHNYAVIARSLFEQRVRACMRIREIITYLFEGIIRQFLNYPGFLSVTVGRSLGFCVRTVRKGFLGNWLIRIFLCLASAHLTSLSIDDVTLYLDYFQKCSSLEIRQVSPTAKGFVQFC